MKLKLDYPEFTEDLKQEPIKAAFLKEFESMKMYEYFYNRFSNNVFLNILNAKKSLNDLIECDVQILLIDCTLEEAFIIALAKELELVQLHKNASLVSKNPECKDLIFRLWASSVNEHQVALKHSIGGNNELNINSVINTFIKDILK